MCGIIKLEKIGIVNFNGGIDEGLKHLIMDYQDDIIDGEESEEGTKFEIYKIV